MGINDDPFNPYRKAAGWEPLFKVSDKRNAADERAKREAVRHTVSYDGLTERGAHFAESSETHESFDSEDDAADGWLKKNGKDAAP